MMIGVGTCKISDKARQYVNEVLDSERLSYGPFIQKFERVFAAAHDCRFGVMTNSGTSSLMIALAELKHRYNWADGDEVIVPAVTFIATSNIVIQNNMKPVFVDVESTYYELDPEKIEAAITPRTRCIIPVHLFGHPCDMEKIMAIARKHKLRVIEDSCETMFTRLNGVSVGSFGDIGCFSTYIAHILTTGVGGLCTTNSPDLAVGLRSLMNHGRDSIYISIDDDDHKTPEELQMIIKRRFSFVRMGYSFRVTEMEGALGLAEFEVHEEMMRKRRENGEFLTAQLKHLEEHLQLPSLRPGAEHAFMMFPIVLKNEKKVNLVNYLEENGIETRDMLPLINQPYYDELFTIDQDAYPVAKWINENGFYIASHQGLDEAQKRFIVDTFTGYFQHRQVQKARSCLIAMSSGDAHAAKLMFDSLPVTDFDECILLDGGDNQEIASFYSQRGFKVISEKTGKGLLLQKAIALTTAEDLIVIGLDGSDNPEDIGKLLTRLKSGAELVVASRFTVGGGRKSARQFSYRSLGNRFFTFMLSIVFSRNLTDCNNLFRGFKKTAVSKLDLSETGDSVMFQMTLMALEKGLKLDESPTVERHAIGQMQKRNRAVSAAAFAWILFKYLVNPNTQGKKRRA